MGNLRAGLKRIQRSLCEKHAVSAAISNVVLAGAVIAVSFVILAWAQYRTSLYNNEYGVAISADVARLNERLAFELVFYSPDDYDESEGDLQVYLINYGTVSNVVIKTVFIRNSTWFTGFHNINLKFLNGTSANGLDIGEEGYFILSISGLVPGKSYSLQVITARGSIFETTFIA